MARGERPEAGTSPGANTAEPGPTAPLLPRWPPLEAQGLLRRVPPGVPGFWELTFARLQGRPGADPSAGVGRPARLPVPGEVQARVSLGQKQARWTLIRDRKSVV